MYLFFFSCPCFNFLKILIAWFCFSVCVCVWTQSPFFLLLKTWRSLISVLVWFADGLDLSLLVADSCSGYFKHTESSLAEFTFSEGKKSKYVLFLKGVGGFFCLSRHRGDTLLLGGLPRRLTAALLLSPCSSPLSLHCSGGWPAIRAWERHPIGMKSG